MDKRELLARLLRKRGMRAGESATFPLTPAQIGMWVQQQLTPDSSAYNIPLCFCLHGKMADARRAVEQVIEAIVDRHEALRIGIVETVDGPRQYIREHLGITVTMTELGPRVADDWQNEVLRIGRMQSHLAFDLTRPPLFRFQLVRVSETLHVLAATFHHIVMDGWSIGVFLKDFARVYLNGRYQLGVALDDMPRPYSDYVREFCSTAESAGGREDADYWRRRLEDAPRHLNLPVEFRAPLKEDFAGTTHAFCIPEPVVSGLSELGKRTGATLFMVAMASFYALLARICDQDDIVLGVSVSNRHDKWSRNVIGLFADVLPIRNRIDMERGFVDLLKSVRTQCLQDYEHATASLTTIMEHLRNARNTDRSAAFRVGFDFQNTPWPKEIGEAISLLNGDSGFAKLDLNFNLSKDRNVLHGVFEYNTNKFSVQTIARIEEYYQRLLTGIVGAPECPIAELDLAGDARPAVDENVTVATPEDETVIDAIGKQAAARAHSVAVQSVDEAATYAELDGRADEVARVLVRRGICAGGRVGLFFEHGVEFLVAMLGVMKAGAVYVPIDPKLPKHRREYICTDANIDLVLASRGRVGEWGPNGPTIIATEDMRGEDGMERITRPEGRDLAYIIYTSGSSGEPKGVMVDHHALMAFTSGAQAMFRIRPGDRVQQFASIGFDASAEEIFPTLTAGATLVAPGRDALGSVEKLLERWSRDRVTVLNLPTALWHEVVKVLGADSGVPFPQSIRLLIIGGEAGSPTALAQWQELVGDRVQLLNTYGPTETTVSVLAADLTRLTDARRRISLPIGRPYAGVRAYILDRHRRRVPVGLYGELFIGGDTVAVGYNGRPEATAERFLPDPFAAHEGGRMYRTGDYCRYLDDGAIEYAGRRDRQIKVSGYRVELQEIETALSRHPDVSQAVAVTFGDAEAGATAIGACVVLRAGVAPTSAGSLREWLAPHLPAYMVPSRIRPVDALPVTVNGKVDHAAVAEAVNSVQPGDRRVAVSATPEEELLLGIWRDVLGIREISRIDNFFELGGHSLLLIRVLSRIRRVFNVDIPFARAFAAGTVESLARIIDEARGGGNGPQKPPITRVFRAEQAPQQSFRQSYAQQRLWFLHLMDPFSSAYNNASVVRITGEFFTKRFRLAVQQMVDRHEILRTVFADGESGPVQIVRTATDVAVEVHDLRDDGDQESALKRMIDADAARPFDLRNGPLLRASVIRCGEDRHVLLFNWHHMITDAWSLRVFLKELAEVYSAGSAETGRAEPRLQYVDYAAWELFAEAEDAVGESLRHWVEQLRGLAAPAHPLPRADERKAGIVSGARVHARVAHQTLCRLHEVARRNEATLFMVCLSAFKVLLARVFGQTDVAVLTPISTRNQQELEGMIGFFLNTLVLRTDLLGVETFFDALRRVRKTCLDGYANKHVPFDLVLRKLGDNRAPDVSFVLENATEVPENFGGARLEPMERGLQDAKFSISLSIREEAEGLSCEWEYSTAVYGDDEIRAFAACFGRLLQGIAQSPNDSLGAIDLLSEGERAVLVDVLGEGDHVPVTSEHMQELFARQAARQPEVAALVYEGTVVSYGELNRRANRLAHFLCRHGVCPGASVGVCLQRSVELAVAILAVWKAGAAYVPLDPVNPAERRQRMAEDAGLECVIGESALIDALTGIRDSIALDDASVQAKLRCEPECEPRPACGTPADRVAYIMYTSGTSGSPKGVVITHRSIDNLAQALERKLREADVGDDCRWAWNASYGFDASVQALVQWRRGATVHLLSPEVRRDPGLLLRYLREWNIDVLDATPLQVEALLDRAGPEEELPTMVIGGEAIGPQLWRRLAARCARGRGSALNVYGPTETTVDATSAWITDERPHIGRPLDNVSCVVVDESGRLQPRGVAGELCIGGSGVALGYANRPNLDSERFVRLECAGGRRYFRTGDRVRWTEDGNLEYRGRRDGQVKVRGYRVEPDEVAHHLRLEPGVAAAAVVARGRAGVVQLVGYVVAQTPAGEKPDVGQSMLSRLREKLPEYMVPAAVVVLEQLPMTPNGKLDISALPDPRMEAGDGDGPPVTETECRLAEVWGRLLGIEGSRIGRKADLFGLGGHSLLIVRMAGAVRDVFGVEVPVKRLFDARRLDLAAKLIDEMLNDTVRGDEALEESEW